MSEQKKKANKREYFTEADNKYGGCGNGYEKEGDSYFISPGHASTFDEIATEEAGLQAYVNTLNLFITEQFKSMAKRKKSWWDSRLSGMSLDTSIDWQYDPYRRCIHPKPAPPSTTEKGGES